MVQPGVEKCHDRYWIIVSDNETIGLAGVYAIDERNKRIYWGRYVASSDHCGKGIGTCVEYLVLQYVFDVLGLNKLRKGLFERELTFQ